MRLYEFTNAEEQLKLLQLIFDTTFSTIRQQAEQQAREKAEQSRLAKLKPKRKSSIKPKSIPSIKVPTPPKPPTKPSTPTANPNQSLVKSNQPPSNLSSQPTQPPPNITTTLPIKTVDPTVLPHIKPIPPIKPTVATKYPIKSMLNKHLYPVEDDEKDSY
jgi:hypothetical protein